MKTKTISIFALILVTLIVTIGLTSAVVSINSAIPELSKSGGSFKLNISTNESEQITISVPDITQGSEKVDFTASPSSISLNNNSGEVTISYVVSSGFVFENRRSYSTTLTLTPEISSQIQRELSFPISNNFCRFDNPANLDISRVRFKVIDGFGKDKEWYPFSEVEVEVRVENNGDWDVSDIELEWEILDRTGRVYMDGEEGDIDLDEGDNDRFTFNIRIDEDVDDLEDGSYTFRVKITGQIDDRNAGDSNRKNSCFETSESVDIAIDRNFVVVEDFSIESVGGSCPTSLSLEGYIWNIGSRDQEDVELHVSNSDLGISKIFKIGDIDSLEDIRFQQAISLDSIPRQGSYRFEVSILDNKGKLFENSNKDKSRFFYTLQVNECGSTGTSRLVLSSPSVVSGGNAGEEIRLRFTLSNLETSTETYTILLKDYASWASSPSLSPSSLTIPAGGSAEVVLSMNVLSGTDGNQELTLEVISDRRGVVLSEKVSVRVGAESGWGLRNLITKDNWYLWVIGALNALLLIVIIIVVVRIVSSRK